jgi:hypothetical protein
MGMAKFYAFPLREATTPMRLALFKSISALFA